MKMKFKNFMMISIIFLLISCTSIEESESSLPDKRCKVVVVSDFMLIYGDFFMQAYDELIFLSKTYDFEVTHMEVKDTYSWIEKTRALAEAEFDLIIGVGWQSGEAFSIIEDSYPHIKFAVIDTVAVDEDIKSISYNAVEGSYILGVMIATAFPNEQLYGYIGNYNNLSNGEYLYGYREGIHSVNPTAEIVIDYANSYSDQNIVYELAMKQAHLGVSFIMGSVSYRGNEGIYKAALDLKKQGVEIYTSGLSTDQTTEKNPYIIGGLTKNTGIAMNIIVREFMTDTFISDNQILGIIDGGFQVVHIEDKANYRNEHIITDDVIEAGKKAFQGLINKNINLSVK